MKRLSVLGLVLVLALIGKFSFAEEVQMSAQEVAAMEAQLFSTLDTMDVSSDAKFAQQLEDLSGNDGDAKCWFWCWRRPWRVYRPAYYYYSWYCPCYMVRFRIVTYSVPVVPVAPVVPAPVVPAPVVPATTAVVPAATAAAAVTPAATAATVATPAATAAAATTAVAPGASQSILQNSQQNIQQTNIAVNGTNNQVVTKFAKSSGQVSKGAVIDQQVPTTSPLYRMGLRSGDIITKVDGNPVSQLVDIRRIKENSTIEYVRGNQIKVAGKPILQSATSDVAKFYTGAPAVEFDTKGIVEVQQTEMTLYEYYDNMAKAEANAASSDMPAQEYGADEY